VWHPDETRCCGVMVSLVDELTLSSRFFNRDDGKGLLQRLGLNYRAVLNVGAIGILPIEPCNGGLFQIVEGGRLAIILPVADERPLSAWEGSPSPIYDLLAFFPEHPEQWFLRIGGAAMLGMETVNSTLLKIEQMKGLRLYSTPLSWLRNECEGAVILKPDQALVYLWPFKEVITDDFSQASAVYHALHSPLPDIPKVMIEPSGRTA
jgi:hypothetical protein